MAPPNYRAISALSGVKVLPGQLDRLLPVGEVEADTKGAAIAAAHEKYPRIPVADLHVERAR